MMAIRTLLVIITFVFISCKQVQKIQDVFVQPTPRELYARTFMEGDTAYFQWNNSFEAALGDSLIIELPYAEVGKFTLGTFPVYSFNTTIKTGEKLVVYATSESDSVPFFIDIHFENSDSPPSEFLLGEKSYGQFPVELTVRKTGMYRVVVQPQLHEKADFKIEIYTQPTLAFPVAGVSDNAIQSFWGASRSGGKRIHEGIDIFAPRSTPVVAVAEGRIGFTGERGLGGKQVWLHEGIFKTSIYYAHLDSIRVYTGGKVSVGDTLGFVGNTGNARTTVPHLHFGIYSRSGAIDPLPFIRKSKRQKLLPDSPTTKGYIGVAKANVRLGPTTQASKISVLENRDTINILGKTVDWYHAKLSNGTHGFIHHKLIVEIEDNITSDLITKQTSR